MYVRCCWNCQHAYVVDCDMIVDVCMVCVIDMLCDVEYWIRQRYVYDVHLDCSCVVMYVVMYGISYVFIYLVMYLFIHLYM